MADEESLAKQAEQLKELTSLRNDYKKVLERENSQILDYVKAKQNLALAERTGIGNIQELRDEVEVYRSQLEDTEEAVVQMTEDIEAQTEELQKNQEALKKSQKRIAAFKKGVDAMTDSNLSSIMSLEGFAANILKVTFALEGAHIELARNTGYLHDFRDNLINVTKRNQELAITMEHGTKIITGLSTGMARFNTLGDTQQGVLEDISARFMRLGVDVNKFGETMDTINYSFGLTGTAAAEAARGLENIANQVGRPLATVVQDLADIGPSLARFGKDGERVFAELAKQARSLGLTTKQAFDVSELFDTFEGAAQIAGRLNAQLGLQLNSVELMKASSEERLELLRAEFQLQGMQFESMGRRQRQMIASILGQDEETAARLLGGRMDIAAFQKETKPKTMTDMVKMQEKVAVLLEQIGLQVAPVLLDILHWVKRNWDELSYNLPRMLVVLGALKGAGFLSKLLGVGGAGAGAAGLRGAMSVLTTTPAGRALALGSAVVGGTAIATGAGGGEKDDTIRSIVTGVAGTIGSFLPWIAGAIGAVPTGGTSMLVAGASMAASGYASQAAAGAAYDWIFGEPKEPAAQSPDALDRSVADLRAAIDARSQAQRPRITMPVTLMANRRELASTIVDINDNDIFKITSPN